MRVSVIWFASLLHFLWGSLLLVSVDPLAATPLATLGSVFGSSRYLLAFVLYTVATAALLGTRHQKLFWLVIPQQVILIISAVGGLWAAAHGMYADGTLRSSLFIVADQAPIILTAPLYTAAVLFDNGHGRAPANR